MCSPYQPGDAPRTILVAVDGPSASGKSTVSKRLAGQLDFIYVDSGSLYRAITWTANENDIPPGDTAGVVSLLDGLVAEPYLTGRDLRFKVNAIDPGDALRSEAVVERVSDLAAIPEVRTFVVDRLRDAARMGNLVMEGRDIGSVVFPDTLFKFYLDAEPEERARRRFAEQDSGSGGDKLAAVRDSLDRRDRKDTSRQTAPLQIPEGASIINTTSLSLDEVVALIEKSIRAECPTLSQED
jgi:cytidylate kinase